MKNRFSIIMNDIYMANPVKTPKRLYEGNEISTPVIILQKEMASIGIAWPSGVIAAPMFTAIARETIRSDGRYSPFLQPVSENTFSAIGQNTRKVAVGDIIDDIVNAPDRKKTTKYQGLRCACLFVMNMVASLLVKPSSLSEWLIIKQARRNMTIQLPRAIENISETGTPLKSAVPERHKKEGHSKATKFHSRSDAIPIPIRLMPSLETP